MDKQVKGGLCVLAGVGVYVLAAIIGVSWLALCFGTVIVGVMLLIFAPGLLLMPFTIGFTAGTALIAAGVAVGEDDGPASKPVSSPPRQTPTLPPAPRLAASQAQVTKRVPSDDEIDFDDDNDEFQGRVAPALEHEQRVAAAKADMERGVERLPSWVMEDRPRREWLDGIGVCAQREGVPLQFTADLLSDKDVFRMFVRYTGNLEHQGLNIFDQREEVAVLVVKNWCKTRAAADEHAED